MSRFSDTPTSTGKTAYVNAHIIDPANGIDGKGGLLVGDGRVLKVGPGVKQGRQQPDTTIIDCEGRILAPGLIDMHVNTGEPGTEYRETLASASRAAAAGGVTTMVLMPDTNPVIDDAAIVDFILRRARDTALVRIAPMAAITKGLAGQDMTEFGLLQEAGAVAVTDAAKPLSDAQVFRRALAYSRNFDLPVMQIPQEPSLAQGVMHEGEVSTRLGLSGIPPAAELIMLERDLRLVELTGARYHAMQLSCAASLEVIRKAKDNGLPVTCGVSINHLLLNENDIGAYRTFFKLSPPLRSEADRAGLVEGFKDGTIDVLVSAHNPQSDDTKRLPFDEAEFGAVGLETLLAGAITLHHHHDVPLPRLIEATTWQPAQILGLETGHLAPGAPADFFLADADVSTLIDDENLHSMSKNTPFEARTLEGRVLQTVVAGKRVYTYA